MRLPRILVELLVIGFALGSASQDQAPASSSAKPKVYEIVSIKPSKPGTPGGGTENLPNGFRDTNITLDILVEGVYCGGPGCSDSFLRFLSGSPCFLFGRRVVLAGG